MGLFEGISRFARSHPNEAIHVLLRDQYLDCLRRVDQLKRHAEQAPQRYSLDALSELAAAEQRQSDRLRQALESAGGTPPAASPTAGSSGGNHWARMVQDLEAHRTSLQQFQEAAVRYAGTHPELASLLEQFSQDEAEHCRTLRALIARADPQALD